MEIGGNNVEEQKESSGMTVLLCNPGLILESCMFQLSCQNSRVDTTVHYITKLPATIRIFLEVQ